MLVGAAFLIALGFGLMAPVLPTFVADKAAAVFPDAAVTATSFLMSSFAIIRLLWATPAGAIANRIGEKQTYVWGIWLCALSTTLIAFAEDYWSLLLFRSFGGVGSVMFTVSSMGLLIRIAPVHMRGRVSALYGGSFLVGNVIGPAFGGLMAGFGVRVIFLTYAAMLVFAGLVMALFMPATVSSRADAEEAKREMPLGEALRNRAFWANLVGSFGNGWGNFGVRFVLTPLLIVRVLGAEEWLAGAAMAVYAIGNAVALPVASSYADRVGRRGTSVIGLAASGLFLALLGQAPNAWVALVVCLLGGLGTGVCSPAMNAVVADVIGSERSGGRVIAVSQMVTDVGAILGPLAAGYLVDASGYGLAFGLSGAILLLGAASWLAAPETLPRSEQRRDTMPR